MHARLGFTLGVVTKSILLAGRLASVETEMSAALKNDKTGHAVPLKDIEVNVKIVDFTAVVVLAQTFYNEEDQPIEAT